MDNGVFSVANSFVEEFNNRVGQLSRLTNIVSNDDAGMQSYCFILRYAIWC